MNYYGRFYRSQLYPLLATTNLSRTPGHADLDGPEHPELDLLHGHRPGPLLGVRTPRG